MNDFPEKKGFINTFHRVFNKLYNEYFHRNAIISLHNKISKEKQTNFGVLPCSAPLCGAGAGKTEEALDGTVKYGYNRLSP